MGGKGFYRKWWSLIVQSGLCFRCELFGTNLYDLWDKSVHPRLNQHWELLWDMRGNWFWQWVQLGLVISPQLNKPVHEVFLGIPFQLIIIFPLAFSSWHYRLFAAVCVCWCDTWSPKTAVKVHIGEKRRGSARSYFLSWGNLLADCATERI